MTYLADTVTLTGTQTLTNKTITSAAFSGTQTGNFTTTGNITIDAAANANFIADRGSTSDVATFDYKTAGVINWAVQTVATNNNLGWLRYVGGAYQDVALQISNSTGNVTIANALEVNGTFTAGISDLANARLYVSDGSEVGRAINITSSDGNGAALIGTSGGATTTNGLVINAYRGSGFIALQTVSTTRLSIASNGYTNIPGVYSETTASAANVFVDTDGSLRRSTSSLRYKINVEDMAYGLKDVLALRPVTYAPKPNGENEAELGKRYGGLIAEEVDAAGLKEFVGYNDEGQPDSLHYGHMVALCIKAIQELKAEVDQLRKQINGSI